MSISRTHVTTENASKYLQQLCKHWGHRFEVRFDPQQGHIAFGEGQSVDLAAHAGMLELSIAVDDADQLDQLETVVADHLKRFAFRETLEFDWQRDTPTY